MDVPSLTPAMWVYDSAVPDEIGYVTVPLALLGLSELVHRHILASLTREGSLQMGIFMMDK